jgi:PAS domain S-box-containing protein
MMQQNTHLHQFVSTLDHANHALQESLDRWQTTFDAISDIVCVISAEHEFLEINLAGLKALGLPREEIIGHKCYSLVHGTDYSLPICPCSCALESGVEESSEYEQGGRIYSLIAWPQKDETGRVISFVHIVKDITDRKKAENALKESEQNFRTLADSGRALIWTAGTDTLCNYFNKVWLDFTGRNLEQELGNGWAEGVHPDDLQRCVHTYLEAFASRKSFTMEYRLRNHSGEYRWILDDGSPRYDAEGEFIGYIGHCLDITDRKKDEDEIHLLNENLELRVQQRTAELIAANKELESFSYSVSHDLRAPLRGIEGFQRIFMDEYITQIPPKGIEYLERAQHSARYMESLIDEMLELSRLSLSEMHIQKTDLSALAVDVVSDLRAADPHRDVDIVIAPDMSVIGDPGFLRIILTNLLGNAWKFTSGREHAHIELGSLVDPKRGVSFFVRDDGIGFDETYKDKLFNAFQRLHSAREFPGTGIGLATVARAVRRHGGEVWASGEVDRGATFYFSIPAMPLVNK